jgi:hypothetical protein
VLFHNSLVACLAEAAVGRWTYAIGDALRSHRYGRQTTKMATAVDDLDRKLLGVRLSSAHGRGDLSRWFKGFAGLDKNVGEDAGFSWPGGVEKSSALQSPGGDSAQFPSRKAESKGGTWSAQSQSAGARRTTL